MYKMLIVEDETFERQALSAMIRTHFANLTIVGEASSGRQAIELAEAHHPDLITMDIHLPGIDGLETIREIKAIVPQAQFIILSAYDTFAYAQQAIKLKVNHYLLKPYTLDELKSTINQVLQELDKLRAERLTTVQLKDQLGQLSALAEIEWVSMLIQHRIHDLSLDRLSQLLGLTEPQGTSAVIRVLSTEAHPLHQAQPLTRIYQEVKKCLKQKSRVMVGAMHQEKIPVILFPQLDSGGKSVRHQLTVLFHQLLHRLQAHPDCAGYAFYVGIGSLAVSFSQLRQSYHEACLAVENTSLPGKLRFYEDMPAVSRPEKSSARGATDKQADHVLEKATAYIAQHYPEDLSLEKVASHVGLSPHYFSKWFKEVTGLNFIDYLTQIRIEQAKTFMLTTSLSLKEICFKVGYRDPNYFSRVFKKQTGLSPSQFKQLQQHDEQQPLPTWRTKKC